MSKTERPVTYSTFGSQITTDQNGSINAIDLSKAATFKRPLFRGRPSDETVPFSLNVFERLCGEQPTNKFIHASEIKKILDIQREYNQNHAVLLTVVDRELSRDWKRGTAGVAKLILEGQSAGAIQAAHPSKDEFMARGANVRRQIKERLRQLRADAQFIQATVANRIADYARIRAVEEEALEIARAEKWGLEFQHSNLLRMLDMFARKPEILVSSGVDPKGAPVFKCLKLEWPDDSTAEKKPA